MFNKAIRFPDVSSGEIADKVFNRVTPRGRLDYNNDQTFIATLRILLQKRCERLDKRVVFRLSKNSYTINDIMRLEKNSALINDVISDGDAGTLTLDLHHLQSDAYKCLYDKFKGGSFPGYRELEDLHQWIVQTLDARFYVNEEQGKFVIITDAMMTEQHHALQVLIPRYFPTLFAGDENKLTEEELKLCASLGGKSSAEYDKIASELCKMFDIRGEKIRLQIGSFERDSRKRTLEAEQLVNDQIRNTMQGLMRNYADKCRELDLSNIKIAGLQATINDIAENSELVDYLIACKNVDLISASDNTVRFTVRTYINNFDVDEFESMCARDNSHVFVGYSVNNSTFEDIETRREFLKAIFSDEPLLKIRSCAYYEINLDGRVTSREHYDFPADYADYIPNVHLHYHNCFGGNYEHINRRIQEHDLIGAIAQCLTTAQNQNVGEGITFTKLMRDLFDANRKKCIELPDGTCVTADDALKWLRERNG